MPALLDNAPPTDAERARNDVHRPIVVVAVLGVLGLYAWLFTSVTPGPLHSHLALSLTPAGRSDADELAILLLGCAVGFLGCYFAPLAYKRPALVATTLALVTWLYGLPTCAGLLAAHVIVYVVLHPSRLRGFWCGVAAAVIATAWGGWVALGVGLVAGLGYRFVLASRAAPIVRTVVIQAPILVVVGGALADAAGGATWTLPLGVLLFFWQWERLILYHVDWKDGRVPADLSIADYLAVFLTPGALPKWTWGVTIGQGYAYATDGFYAEDKNRLALRGLVLWLWALVYLVAGDAALRGAVRLLESAGVPLYDARITHLVDAYLAGRPIQQSSVLLTTVFDVLRWLVLWGGIVHFKVGLWRVCGYRVDPYFDRPFLATNLVAFWSRFTFHYRAFLARAFYYPVFFRCFRRHKRLRIVVATLAAATTGNLLWGHLTEKLFYRGLEWRFVPDVLATWPYFVALGLGIGLSELWLLRKGRRRRKPWTWGPRIFVDVACAFATVQFYGLITIFARPEGASPGALLRLIGIGLGVCSP